MQTGYNTDYIYKNHLDKACFQHDMAYGKYKNLAKITQADKVLTLQVIQNMMVINMGWLQWYTNFLIKSQKTVV